MSRKSNSLLKSFILIFLSLLVARAREFEIHTDHKESLEQNDETVYVNEFWSIDLSTTQDDSDSVHMVKFQEDSIVSTDTLAQLNGTIPDLETYSLCFWLKVYYWRSGSPIVSYALSTELDNYILITLNRDVLEVMKGEYYLLFVNHGFKTLVLKWTHFCLVESAGLVFYIDGNAVMPVAKSERQYNNQSSAVALKGGGNLVLGQDQDTIGGGYQVWNTLSGSIADFQLFSAALSHQDVQMMFMCQRLTKTPILDLKDKRWEFKNVVNFELKRKELCNQRKRNAFYFFKKYNDLPLATQHCKNLGGSLLEKRSVKDMLLTLIKYFKYWQENYAKFHVHVDVKDKRICSDLVIRWQRDTYIKAAIDHLTCSKTLKHLVCEFKTRTFLTMSGIPQSIEGDTDSLYQLYRSNGKNILQGIKRSTIEHDKGRWCLYRLGGAKSDVIFCCQSGSGYPPLGRKLWTHMNDNTTSLIALTSCSEHQFTCDSGDCIDLSRRCDTHNDCSDQSDENKCSPVYNSKEQKDSITRGPQKPLFINGSVKFIDIPHLNLDENIFLTSLWINITWKDPRVNFLNLANETETFISDYIKDLVWVPDFALKPLQNAMSLLSSATTIKKICDGERQVKNTMEENVFSYNCTEIWVRRFFHVTWQCVFNLKKFPFESVECLLNIGLELEQLWSDDVQVYFPALEHLPYEVTMTSQDISGSVLMVKLLFQRKSGSYIATTFIPIVILLMITLLTFFFEEQDFTNRVMVTISVLIVVASLFAQVANSLPNTSYTKCIDVVFLCTIFFLSLVFGCHVLLALIRKKRNEALNQQIKPVRVAKVNPTNASLEMDHDKGRCVSQKDRDEASNCKILSSILAPKLLAFCICGSGAIIAISFSVINCT